MTSPSSTTTRHEIQHKTTAFFLAFCMPFFFFGSGSMSSEDSSEDLSVSVFESLSHLGALIRKSRKKISARSDVFWRSNREKALSSLGYFAVTFTAEMALESHYDLIQNMMLQGSTFNDISSTLVSMGVGCNCGQHNFFLYETQFEKESFVQHSAGSCSWPSHSGAGWVILTQLLVHSFPAHPLSHQERFGNTDKEFVVDTICEHENVKLLVDKLYQRGLLLTNSISDLLASIACDTTSKTCMYRIAKCCYNEIEFEGPLEATLITWQQWSRVVSSEEGKTFTNFEKVTQSGKCDDLLALLNKKLDSLAKHQFNWLHKVKTLRELKETLREDEVCIHVDFSENYGCKLNSEIQAFHFGGSRKQVTIHTCVAYTASSSISYATLSASPRHDERAVWAHMEPVLRDVIGKCETPPCTLHIISDGPVTQYRNKKNFYLLSTVPFLSGFQRVTWNFSEKSHGKGAPDGVGGAVKRIADTAVKRGTDLQTAEELYNFLKDQPSSINYYWISEEAIAKYNGSVPKNVPAVKGTLKIHQVTSEVPAAMQWREISCFCARPRICNCYGPSAVDFRNLSGNHPSTSTECQQDLKGKFILVRYERKPFVGQVMQVAICQILNVTLEGKARVKSLDEQQSITSKHRRLLVRLLVSHLLENNGETPSSDTKKTLAMSLVCEFPCLKDDTGNGYISQDFEQVHPEAAPKLFENWAAVSDRILAYAQREGKLHLVLDDMTPDPKTTVCILYSVRIVILGFLKLKLLPEAPPYAFYENENPMLFFFKLTMGLRNLTSMPYYAAYMGHKLHMDQNEKMAMFGVTYILAIDGYNGKLVDHAIMPKKKTTSSYMRMFTTSWLRFYATDETLCQRASITPYYGIRIRNRIHNFHQKC
ncbi:hypothetical protein ABVT39_010110 [Epinephelus coioides]